MPFDASSGYIISPWPLTMLRAGRKAEQWEALAREMIRRDGGILWGGNGADLRRKLMTLAQRLCQDMTVIPQGVVDGGGPIVLRDGTAVETLLLAYSASYGRILEENGRAAGMQPSWPTIHRPSADGREYLQDRIRRGREPMHQVDWPSRRSVAS